MNHQFTFEGRLKTFILALVGVGILSMVITFLTDSTPEHARFWTNFLHNSVFFTGIAFCAVLFLATHTLAWGGWHTVFKRIPEAMLNFLPVGAGLLLLIWLGIGGFHNIYGWGEPNAAATDPLVAHKAPFLNKTMYLISILIVGVWYLFGYMLRKISLNEDANENEEEQDYPGYKRRKVYAAAFLPIAGFSSAFAIWQWVMSVDYHWYSTLFAWYCTVSVWVSMVSLMVLIIFYMKNEGYFQNISDEHLHDLGKYMFGFSVFWTYLWFSQFMLIWYANNGEETIYFDYRINNFPILFYGNFILNFILPFLILMRNSNKRKMGTMIFMAVVIIFGHWIDFFQMIKPAVYKHFTEHHHSAPTKDIKGESHGHGSIDKNKEYKVVLTNYQDELAQHTEEHKKEDGHTQQQGHGEEHKENQGHDTGHAKTDDHAKDAHNGGHHSEASSSFMMGFHIPGLLEIGTMLGFLGMFLFVFFTFLSKASLTPKNDPFYDESVHHHV